MDKIAENEIINNGQDNLNASKEGMKSSQENPVGIISPEVGLNTNPEIKVENLTPDTQSSNPEVPQKKFNGFLRNNNKKHTKKPTPDMHIKPQNKNPNKPNPHNNTNKHPHNPNKSPNKIQGDSEPHIIPHILEPKQTQEEYEVFNFLRNKTGHNEKKFWENLSIILNQKTFSDIKKSNLSLIGYAVLHDSTIVFDKLLNQFESQVSKDEFGECTFKYSIHKNPELVKSCLNFYEKNFSVEQPFLEKLITDIAYVSYRFETNQLFLSWISKKLNPELLNLFWTQAISNKNIPIILQSLEYKEYFQYLHANLNLFEDSLKSIGRFIQVKGILDTVKTFKKVDDLKQSAIISNETRLVKEEDFEPKIWLSDKSEQFKVIQENLSDKKPTEVIIKKKRKII